MERDGNKVQRSESFDVTKDQRIQPISNDVSKINRLSVSESSILQMEAAQSEAQTISPGSSEAGTMKKSKKFKPKKFLAKTFGSKKSVDESEPLNNVKDVATTNVETPANDPATVQLSEKASPKVKKSSSLKKSFLNKLTKKSKVGPQTGSLEAGMEDIEKSNIKKMEDLSVSQTSLVDMEDPEVREVPKPEITVTDPVTLESRKVQMKITMSAKKIEKKRERDATMTLPTIDSIMSTKASSPPTPLNTPQTTDIELPSASDSTLRSAFYNLSNEANEKSSSEMENKPIKAEAESVAVGDEQLNGTESASEIEKYLILTSSLNTIISAAKDLEDLQAVAQAQSLSKDIKFPENLPELKIRESLPDQETDEESMKKHVVSYKKSSEDGTGSGSLSDGKETATVHTQQAHKPQQLTLSSSSSEDNKSKSPETNGLKTEEIKFDIGTPVRPLRTSSSGVLPSPSIDSAAGDSIDQVFYSPTSDISDPSDKPEENSRRKIVPFVPQLTIYTPEEQELLRKNVEANVDSLSQDSSLYPNFDDTLVRMLTIQ